MTLDCLAGAEIIDLTHPLALDNPPLARRSRHRVLLLGHARTGWILSA